VRLEMKHASPRHPVALAFSLILAACGGSTSTLGSTDGGDAGNGGDDGGSSPLGPECPAATPASGTSCTGSTACEYGSDPDLRCDTVATCTAGHFVLSQPTSSSSCATTNPSTCPASYAALTQGAGSTCSPSGITCEYPEARCSCETHCGMIGFEGDGGPVSRWCCPDAPPGAGCPSPRPRLGSSCTAASDTVCDYGFCSGNVALQCVGGVWQEATMLGCPG
jgi:hypothetical protein